MIGAAIYAAVFVANTLSLPTLALVLGIQHRHVKLDMFLHPVLFPFTASVFVSLVLYFVSKRRLFKFSGHDILATKVVLAFLLLVAVQAAEACVIDLVLIAFVKMRIVGYNEIMKNYGTALYSTYRHFQCRDQYSRGHQPHPPTPGLFGLFQKRGQDGEDFLLSQR